jgi:hypothetical protein
MSALAGIQLHLAAKFANDVVGGEVSLPMLLRAGYGV